MHIEPVVLLLVCLVTVPAVAETNLSVTVTGPQVTVEGVTPNGDVVLFARTHRHVGGTPHLGRHASVERDADGDGVVALTVPDLPPHSVWVAVDQQTGSHAIAMPAGRTPNVIALPAGRWREGIASVDVESGYLDILLVRPGKGAWRLDIMEGGGNDGDGKGNASLRARLGILQHLTGKEQAPSQALKKDVLAIIDPRTLDVFVKAAE